MRAHLPRAQKEMVNIKGSPTNWKVDAGEDPELVEVDDKDDLALNPGLSPQVGKRNGEKRSMYLSLKDF